MSGTFSLFNYWPSLYFGEFASTHIVTTEIELRIRKIIVSPNVNIVCLDEDRPLKQYPDSISHGQSNADSQLWLGVLNLI